jgi:hypothetical protein
MTAGWVLPRDWDAGRLLRFLTGLALLALAFAANAGMITTPAGTAPAAPATTTTTVDVPATADVPATTGDPAAVDVPAVLDVPAAEMAQGPAGPAPAVRPVADVRVIEIGLATIEPAVVADPAGVAQRSHGSRAPPAV